MTTQSRLHLRLFLEGLEVSVVEASISMTSGNPASANIQVIFTPEIMKLLPRTLVHLFFFDASLDGEDPYRLLFAGDLVSVNVTKSEQSRTATLICADHMDLFNYAYIFFSKGPDLARNSATSSSIHQLTQSRAIFTNASSNATVTDTGIQSLIQSIFNDPRPSYIGFTGLDGALGGVIKTIETFTGITSDGSTATNAFYAYNTARLNLLGTIGMYAKDFTSKQILKTKAILDLLTQKSDQLGDLTTLNTLINFILGFIYHRITPNTCAKFTAPSTVSNVESTTNTDKVKKSALFIKTQTAVQFDNLITDKINPLARISDLRIMLSIILPEDAVKDLNTVDENGTFRYQPTGKFCTTLINPPLRRGELEEYGKRLPDGTAVGDLINQAIKSKDPVITNKVSSLLRSLIEIGKGIGPLNTPATVDTFSTSAQVDEVDLSQNTDTRLSNESRLSSLLGSTDPNNVRALQDIEQTRNHTKQFLSALDSLSKKDKLETEYSSYSSPTLYNTIITPDLFFSVAPKCNVLFPDQYFTLSYNRAISQEVTRFHLETVDDLTSTDINSVYYAPATADIRGLQGKFLSKNNQEAKDATLANRLMDHELHTGIVPSFSTIVKSVLTPLGSAELNTQDKEDFFATIANYRFLKERLSKRQLTVNGIFNPYASPGFPGIVIDTPNEKDSQYIGLITSVTHNINQQGGTTSYQFEYARSHTADDDRYVTKFQKDVTEKVTTKELTLDSGDLVGKLENAIENGEPITNILNKIKLIAENSTYVTDLSLGESHIDLKDPIKGGTTPPFKREDDVIVPVFPSLNSSLLSELSDSDSKIDLIVLKDATSFSNNSYGVSIGEGEDLTNIEGLLSLAVHIKESFKSGSPVTHLGNVYRLFFINYFFNLTKVFVGLSEGALKDFIANSELGAVEKKVSKNLFRKQKSRFNEVTDESSLIAASAMQEIVTSDFTDNQVAAVYILAKKAGVRCLFNTLNRISVKYSTKELRTVGVPIEESMRPGFIDGAYSSPLIGPKVYSTLLGTGSVVDVPEGSLPSDIKMSEITVRTFDSNDKVTTETHQTLSQEDAITLAIRGYNSSKSTSTFIKNYTKRPIATIREVLSDPDVGFHYKAYASSNEDASKEIPFMGRAFEVSDKEPILDGFVELGEREQQELKNKRIDVRVDVRVERSEAVSAYINSLRSRGLRG